MATFFSYFNILSLSLKIILFIVLFMSEKNDLTVDQNSLLSATPFIFKSLRYSFFTFLRILTHLLFWFMKFIQVLVSFVSYIFFPDWSEKVTLWWSDIPVSIISVFMKPLLSLVNIKSISDKFCDLTHVGLLIKFFRLNVSLK